MLAAAAATATTKDRSKNSSSGVAERCDSSGSRPDIGRCHGIAGTPLDALMTGSGFSGHGAENALEHLLCPGDGRSLARRGRAQPDGDDLAPVTAAMVAESAPSALPLPAHASSAPSAVNPGCSVNSCGRSRGTGCPTPRPRRPRRSVCSQVTTARTLGDAASGERSEHAAVGLPGCLCWRWTPVPRAGLGQGRAQVGGYLGLHRLERLGLRAAAAGGEEKSGQQGAQLVRDAVVPASSLLVVAASTGHIPPQGRGDRR